MRRYDYLIVGAGLFGSVFAQRMTELGKRCLIVEKRGHVGGNIYTREVEGIQVHEYGPHIFHTVHRHVWSYVNRFAEFNHFRYEPLAVYEGRLYHLPFNMNTFHEMWGVRTPAEAEEILARQRAEITGRPGNLEEQAISLVGRDIYEILIQGYTEKQWGRPCRELPGFIIRRLPLRMRYDNNYFDDPYQGIPVGGYTRMIERMLKGIPVELNTDFFSDRERLRGLAETVLYTGPLDAYFGYRLGALEYRSLRFETEILDMKNYQGAAGVNYTERGVPFTRITEHKHFEFGNQDKTVITREYPLEWRLGEEPYYPVNDERNVEIYEKYREMADREEHVLMGGRLADYLYYNMDSVVRLALKLADREAGKRGERADEGQ